MGLFGSLFGNSAPQQEDEKIPWIPLVNLQQLEEIREKSKERPQVIFKHSTTCGISRMVLNMFRDNYRVEADKMDIYFLDLHAHREISNEVAIAFQAIHQSPQLLIIKNEETIFHTSHGAISEVDLNDFA